MLLKIKTMHTLKTIFTLTLAVFFMASCQSDSGNNAKSDTETTQTSTDNSIQPIVPPSTPPAAEPAQNTAGVWHYTCPKGCEGGAGTQTACAVCGETLAHNAAYHNTGATPNTANPIETTPPPTSPAVANPEPAQNANGVWHFTCAKGCPGGAGTAQPCTTCGEILSHNQAYHQ